MLKPWKMLESNPAGDFRIFTIRRDHKLSPRTGALHDFYVIDSVNWVNVIAITPEEKLVMVEQYRHGSDTIELEIPGGMMDANESSPIEAGVRELREETGYEGEKAIVIGKTFSNPEIMSNMTFTVMVTDCVCKHPVKWDSGEDIATRLVPIAEIPDLVASGKIGHSLVVVALYHFQLWRRKLGKV